MTLFSVAAANSFGIARGAIETFVELTGPRELDFVYCRLDPKSGMMAVFGAPRGIGPYGIAATPDGQVFFASLAGNYLGRLDLETGITTVLEPPVPR